MALTITFSDKTQLTNLQINGNNLVSTNEADMNVMKAHANENYLGHIVIEGDDNGAGVAGTYQNAELLRCEKDDGLDGYAFVIREISAEEMKAEELEARVKFLELMEEAE